MKPQELQDYLTQHIPITQALGVQVRQCSPQEVVLFAPLAPNINHRDTVFGGSASALAILSAWALLHVRLADDTVRPRLVIQQNSMRYDKPIAGDFHAVCRFDSAEEWQRFRATLNRHGRARLTLIAVLQYNSREVAKFEGRFVAVMP